MFAEDANEMVVRIMDQVKSMGEEIDIEDGFALYRALTTIRRLFTSTMPEYDPLIPYFSVELIRLMPINSQYSLPRPCREPSGRICLALAPCDGVGQPSHPARCLHGARGSNGR